MRNKNKSYIIGFLLVASILGYLIVNKIIKNQNERDKLLENGIKTVGIVKSVYNLNKRGTFVKYTYRVNGQEYQKDQSLSKIDRDQIKIGDKFQVLYSEEHHKTSYMMFEKRID